MDIPSHKKRLRQAMTERGSGLREQDRQAESRSLCRRVLQHFPADIRTVAAYYPMRTEADITPLLEEFLRRGMELYLPRAEGKTFTYRRATSLAALKPGSLRIPEPDADAPVLDDASLDLALIPGAAFDRDCNRLGRGNGGYDIWIEKQRKANPQTRFIGVALECQVVNIVPSEAHDQRMDAIATARGVKEAVPPKA